MASKKKGNKKPTHRRKKRMGAKGADLTLLLSALGGFVVGEFAKGFIKGKLPATVSETNQGYITNGAEAVGGFFLTKVKNPIAFGAGVGLAIGGGAGLLKSANILKSIGYFPTDGQGITRIAGTKNVRSVGATDLNNFPRPSTVGKKMDMMAAYGLT